MDRSKSHLTQRTENRQQRLVPSWLPHADLACVATAGAAWYARPEWGPWPLVLVLVPWLARWVLTGRPTRRTPLDLPLALFLATAGMGVWASFHQETAWAKFWIIVGAVAIYYVLANQPDAAHVRSTMLLFALFGAGVAGYFVATHDWSGYGAKITALAELGEAIQGQLPYVPGHRMHPNVVGGMLAMIVPFQIVVLASIFRSPAFRTKGLVIALVLAALAITMFGLVMTTSRGAWLALSLVLMLWAMWTISGWRVGKGQRGTANGNWRARTRRLGMLVPGVVIVVGLGLILIPSGTRTLLAAIPAGGKPLDRVALASRALYLVQDVPFTGGGLGGFAALDTAYLLPIDDWRIFQSGEILANVHSHNLLLDIPIEQGVPGLLAYLWMLGLWGTGAWQTFKTASRWQDGVFAQGVIEAAIASMLVVLGHGLVDDALYGSRGVLLLFVPMGFAVAASKLPSQLPSAASQSRSRLAFRVAVPAAMILLGVMGLIWGRPLMATWHADLGAVAQARTELAGYQSKGWSLPEVRSRADLSQAIFHLEQALVLNARQPTANLRLGMIHLARGQYEEAEPLLETAYSLRPGLPAARQMLGDVYLALGRLEEAAALWHGVGDASKKLLRQAAQFQAKGDTARAADVYRVVLMIDPTNEGARQGLSSEP